jgi:hypothetical protein
VAIPFFAGLLDGQNAPESCPLRVACKAKIEIGEGYVTRTETIEATITILDVLRGEEAWELVRSASSANKPANPGMEYIAARIRFEFGSKEVSGALSYGIRFEQFSLASESGKQYDRPSLVQPKPELSGRLYPGDSLEGWLVFLVSSNDGKPMMSFGHNYNRVWFRLFIDDGRR